jgi:RNA recognition motif-containing protein
MPVDRVSGRPRGIAFVEFDSAAGVAGAIEKFNGHELSGRTLRVNEAEARPARAPRGGFADAGRGGGGDFFGSKPPAKPKGSRRNIRRSKRSL